jgi:hypothetical protein
MTDLGYTHQELFRVMGSAIGIILREEYPPVTLPQMTVPQAIPKEAIVPMVEGFQILIAEFIQAWIDAGSEREVTMENDNLFEAIRDELLGWSNAPKEES